MNACHDHQPCINEREQLLKLIWASHKPCGAYELIDQLAEQSGRRIAPPTVYRTLGFLLNVRLIHRIHSLNAYVCCLSPNRDHPSYFLICTECHSAKEYTANNIQREIEGLVQQEQFTVKQQWLEVLGTCKECQQQKI